METGAGLAQCVGRATTCHTADTGQPGFESFAASLPPSLPAPALLSFLHCVGQISWKKAKQNVETKSVVSDQAAALASTSCRVQVKIFLYI